eukprot:6450039-Alexandrium_andersonii.AAC.1
MRALSRIQQDTGRLQAAVRLRECLGGDGGPEAPVEGVHEFAEAAHPRPLANEVRATCWAHSGGRRAL